MKRRLILSAMALLIVFGCCCEVFADSRFTDNGDGTLTDTQTGLMWLKDLNCMKKKYSSDPQDTLEKTWQDALKRVADFNTNPGNYDCSGYTAAYNDWVLPNVNELETLVNTDIANPYVWLNGQGFSNALAKLYWTSTTSAPDNLRAWHVDMNTGTVINDSIKSTRKNYILPVRGQTQATASLPVYKTGQKISFSAGDDGDLQRGIAWPSTRFTDNNDGTVTDNLTGLMWLKSADCFGRISWQTALDNITGFNANPGNYTCNAYIGNYTDWRLPTHRELRTLIDYSRNNPALPQDNPHPFTGVSFDEYWTNIAYAINTEAVWIIRPNVGYMTSRYKSEGSHVWPVRGSSIGPSMPIWDADKDNRWSLPDIIYGLKVLSGK